MSEQSEYAIRDALTKIWGQSAGHWMGTNSFPFDYCMAEYVFMTVRILGICVHYTLIVVLIQNLSL